MNSNAAPWPDARVRDRILMLCGTMPSGAARRWISRELRVPGFMLKAPLASLVEGGWLGAEHPDGTPNRDSFYTLNQDREGLRELQEFWYIEHGYVAEDRGLSLDGLLHGPEDKNPLCARAAASAEPVDDAATLGRAYRSLHREAIRQRGRTVQIERALQDIYSRMKWDNERARDLIHLPTEHTVPLPPASPDEAEGLEVLLRLAWSCRENAREDMWKFTYLWRMASAASARVQAMSSALIEPGHPLAPFMLPPADVGVGEVLRAGLTMSRTAEFLTSHRQYAGTNSIGFAGDVMVAFTYFDIAQKLEKVVESIVTMPALVPAAQSDAGRELLGEAVDFEVPRDPWNTSSHRALDREQRRGGGLEFADPVTIEQAEQLRAGDRIVAVGRYELAIPVDVLARDRDGDSVELTLEGDRQGYEVPMAQLGYWAGLTVRRPLVATI